MALLQLVSRGFEDEMLTGSPSTSHFISRYKRHTPFASVFKEEVFTSNTSFGSRAVIRLSSTCDLMHTCIVEATMKKTGVTFYPMEQFIKSVDVYIGGILIDTHDSTWFRIYDGLYRSVDERAAYRNAGDFSREPDGTTKTVYLPLIFWWNRHISHSLPIVALDQPVELVFTFAEHVEGIDLSIPPRPKVYVEHIFLGSEERSKFVTGKHVILMEQLQRQQSVIALKDSLQTTSILLEARRPVKSFIWACTHPKHGVFSGSLEGLESNEVYGPLAYCRLLVDGTEHTQERSGSWYRTVHALSRLGRLPPVGVYSIMFAKDPGSSVQPSGSLNCSVVQCTLQLATKKAVDKDVYEEDETPLDSAELTNVVIYAQSWNVLEIENGTAALQWTT